MSNCCQSDLYQVLWVNTISFSLIFDGTPDLGKDWVSHSSTFFYSAIISDNFEFILHLSMTLIFIENSLFSYNIFWLQFLFPQLPPDPLYRSISHKFMIFLLSFKNKQKLDNNDNKIIIMMNNKIRYNKSKHIKVKQNKHFIKSQKKVHDYLL